MITTGISLILLLAGWMLPDLCGFLVLVGYLVPVMYPPKRTEVALWLLCIALFHMSWIGLVASAHWRGACILSGGLVLYITIAGVAIRELFYSFLKPVRQLWVIAFLFWAHNYSAPWQPDMGGYPFFSPLPPLMIWLQQPQSLPSKTWTTIRINQELVAIYHYPTPTESKGALHPLPYIQNLCDDLYHIPKPPTACAAYIVSPESMIPFSVLQEYREWLQSSLPPDAQWLLGATHVHTGKKYQSALHLTKQSAVWIDKQSPILFFETVPRHLHMIAHLCGASGDMHSGEKGKKEIFFTRNTPLHVSLCSEALSKKNGQRECALMNETNLPRHVRRLFIGSLAWKAFRNNLSLLVVGHTGWWYMNERGG